LGDGGTGRLRFFWRSKTSPILDGPTNTIADDTWYYVAGVVDVTNQDRFIYVNGVQNAADLTDAGSNGTDGANASIGGETASSGETGLRFEGLLDEIRVANVARSADWLLTEFNNQNNPSGFYSVGTEEALSVNSQASGDWDLTTTWASGIVPTVGAKVTITRNVDLDDRDMYICNLTVSNESSANGRIQVEGAHVLEVKEYAEMLGNTTGDFDVTVRTNTGSDKIIFNRDLSMTHSDGDDMFIDVQSAGDSIIVRGSLFYEHTDGDDTEIRVDNATAVLEVQGNVVVDLEDGDLDVFDIDLNAGQFNVLGYVDLSRRNNFSDITIDLDGGDFTMDSLHIDYTDGDADDIVQITIDEASTMTVTNGVSILSDGGDDFNLYLNQNAGTSAELSVGGDLYWNKTGGDDINIFVDDANSEFNIMGKFLLLSQGGEQVTFNLDGGTMTVGDTFQISHLDGAQQTFIDIDGSHNLTADNFIASLDNNGNQEFLVDVDATAQINVTNDMILTINDGNDLELHLG
jgi:hypothetical protein